MAITNLLWAMTIQGHNYTGQYLYRAITISGHCCIGRAGLGGAWPSATGPHMPAHMSGLMSIHMPANVSSHVYTPVRTHYLSIQSATHISMHISTHVSTHMSTHMSTQGHNYIVYRSSGAGGSLAVGEWSGWFWRCSSALPSSSFSMTSAVSPLGP